MAYMSGHLGAVSITVGGVDVTWDGDLRSWTLAHNIALHDVTIFADINRRRIPGVIDWTLTFDGFFSDASAANHYDITGSDVVATLNLASPDKITTLAGQLQSWNWKKDVDDAVRITGTVLCSVGGASKSILFTVV